MLNITLEKFGHHTMFFDVCNDLIEILHLDRKKCIYYREKHLSEKFLSNFKPSTIFAEGNLTDMVLAFVFQ